MKPRRPPERGQASVESVGLALLVALVFAALAAVTPLGGLAGSVAGALTGAFAGGEPVAAAGRPAESSWAEQRALVERYLAAPLGEFLAYRVAPDRDPRLDYSTNECSAPLVGSTGASFDFTEACLRHDFGYRNYDRLGVFEQRKAAVDERFLADMSDHCAGRAAGERDRCFAWARVFYEAVKRFGHLSGHGRSVRRRAGARGSARRPRRRPR